MSTLEMVTYGFVFCVISFHFGRLWELRKTYKELEKEVKEKLRGGAE